MPRYTNETDREIGLPGTSIVLKPGQSCRTAANKAFASLGLSENSSAGRTHPVAVQSEAEPELAPVPAPEPEPKPKPKRRRRKPKAPEQAQAGDARKDED